jgi:hypothetical protein
MQVGVSPCGQQGNEPPCYISGRELPDRAIISFSNTLLHYMLYNAKVTHNNFTVYK